MKTMENRAVRIVRLTGEDREKLLECAKLLFVCFEHAWNTMEEAEEDMLRIREAGPVLAAVEEELVVGFIGTRATYEPYGWELHPLAVEERSRKKGIGSLLIKEIEKEAVNRGAIVMYLGTDDEDGATSLSEGDLFIDTFHKIKNIKNKKNHPYEFYEKNGYQIVGVLPDVNGYGRPDIYMAKRLCEKGGKSMNDVKAVKVFTAQDNLQAEMVLDTLKQNQIPAYKKDVDESGFMNIYAGNSMCGEEIYVAQKDEEKTMEILREMGLEPEKVPGEEE